MQSIKSTMEFCDRLQTNIPLLVNEVSRARHVATAGIILYTVSICVWYAYSAYKTGYPVDTNAGNNAAATCPAGNNAAATCPAGSNPAATCPVTTYPTYVPYLPTCPVGGPWYKNHAIEFTLYGLGTKWWRRRRSDVLRHVCSRMWYCSRISFVVVGFHNERQT